MFEPLFQHTVGLQYCTCLIAGHCHSVKLVFTQFYFANWMEPPSWVYFIPNIEYSKPKLGPTWENYLPNKSYNVQHICNWSNTSKGITFTKLMSTLWNFLTGRKRNKRDQYKRTPFPLRYCSDQPIVHATMSSHDVIA